MEAASAAGRTSSMAAQSAITECMPDVVGFVATAPARTPGYVRREYVHESARVTVTVARMSTLSLSDWVRMTRQFDYPVAKLDVPESEALGFFDCGDAGGCDLHVQTATGLHIEVQSSGTATRAELSRLMVGLPTRSFERCLTR